MHVYVLLYLYFGSNGSSGCRSRSSQFVALLMLEGTAETNVVHRDADSLSILPLAHGNVRALRFVAARSRNATGSPDTVQVP